MLLNKLTTSTVIHNYENHTLFAFFMWLLVVSRSCDYWLGLSPHVTLIALVDVEVCLDIPLCVTRRVPRGSRGLILGSTERGASHSWEHWKGAPLFVSRQCFPNTPPCVNPYIPSLTCNLILLNIHYNSEKYPLVE